MSDRRVATRDKSAAEALSNVGNRQNHLLTLATLGAIRRLNLTDVELASHLRISATQLSRQIANKDGHYLQVQRFDVLPTHLHALFIEAFLDELASLTGRAIVTSDGYLSQIAKAMRSMGDAVEALAARPTHAVELSEPLTPLALALREARLRANLTQSQLAEASGVDAIEIVKIESGKTASPSWSDVGRLCRALKLSTDDLPVAPAAVGGAA